PRVARALPTMIRLGYSDCASCHLSPQGGGLLTDYGRVVDEAQSRRAEDYQPSDNALVRFLNAHGRIHHDVRAVGLFRGAQSTGAGGTSWFARVVYRNATQIKSDLRVSAVVGAELGFATGAPAVPGTLFASQALISYRPLENVEISLGRDALPVGVQVPDLAL